MQLGCGRNFQEETSRIKQMPPVIHYFTGYATDAAQDIIGWEIFICSTSFFIKQVY